jgi:glycosyltransferase involved in cell wall biosynthesis
MSIMKISVIVPVYNEERTVKKVLQELLKIPSVAQIIVVNDGSTDRSAKQIKSVKSPKIQYLEQVNTGKGRAVLNGLKKVKEKYLLIQDADLEYHPQDIPLLIEPILRREAVQVVFGSRFLGPHSNLLYWHMVGNKFLNFLVNILYDTTLSDLETCYKLLPTSLLRELDLKSTGFEIETEITCKVLKQGIRIFEVPISYVGRDFTEGKKITWKDGVKAIWSIVKYRIT